MARGVKKAWQWEGNEISFFIFFISVFFFSVFFSKGCFYNRSYVAGKHAAGCAALEEGTVVDHRKSTLAKGSRWDYTILGGNSYLSWFYDRGAIKDPARTGTSKGLPQAINRGPIRTFLPYYANIYVTIQSHAPSAGVRTHYVTANGVRNGLGPWQLPLLQGVIPHRRTR